MKVRIKKVVDWDLKYAVQYKKFGLFWKTFDQSRYYEDALDIAQKLEAWHGVYSLDEFRKLEENK